MVGLEGSGGSAGLIAEHGLLAARSDLAAAAAAIETLLDLPGGEKQRRAKARVAAIARDFRYDDYVYDLTAIAGLHHSRISVVVPNYNYVHYIAARLDSIYDQTHPLFEVIVLDDKSTDQSLARIKAYAGSTGRDFHLAANQANSASGYKQWLKGAGMARGDYVWIAEADDLADPAFLDRAASILDNSDAAFVFCDSRQIDEDGKELAGNYQYYYKDLGAGVLSTDFIMDGPDFVRRFLSVKNVILNVSGVLWRRNALLHALAATAAEHLTMRVACDWKMYAIAALECGPVGFVAEPLNVHRRHSRSVTKARDAGLHYAEITAAQDFVASRLELDAKTLARREAYRKEVKVYLAKPIVQADMLAKQKFLKGKTAKTWK